MATLAQVALGPGPGEKAWQVYGILPCIFCSTDELEEARACSLSRSESTKVVDLKRFQDERSHDFSLWRKGGEWALPGAREEGQQPGRYWREYTRLQKKMQGLQDFAQLSNMSLPVMKCLAIVMLLRKMEAGFSDKQH